MPVSRTSDDTRVAGLESLGVTQVQLLTSKQFASMGRKTVETEWLTANEAAQYLKVKPRTLLQWAREKKIPSHKLSGVERCVWRFLRPELDAMLRLSSADPAEGRQ